MRFQKKKAAVLAVALGVVGVLVTALPALAAADTVTGFTPVCGVVGTPVTITGSGFTGTANTATAVTFPGAVNSPINAGATDTVIVSNVPAGATGTAQLTVVDAGENATSAASFTVVTAAAATITSFVPVSGAIGSPVVITGTNFCGTTGVKFNTTAATSFTVNSNTQITATVPVGATTGKITVTNTIGPVVSAADYTVLTGIPTITSFAPASGPVGTSVVITGTNFAGTTFVKFNGTTATFTVNSATQITASVPTGAATGTITVQNPLGTGTSATSFTVVVKHARTVSFALKKHLIASGTVSVNDGFNACRSDVTVKIQLLKNGTWKTIGTDQTTGNGKYTETLNDKAGKYRAIAKKEVLNSGADVCVADTSAPAKHHH